ncbi:MAG: hypothetical protein KDE27_22665 [Planctomycetes bacterium]|nr:hypothetical protein [Planctomycetota bacterium]
MRRVRRKWWRRLPRRRQLAVVVALLLLGLLWWFAGSWRHGDGPWSRREMLDAIRFVESGWREHPPDGDGGRAIGPYQIHRIYWRDALEFEPGLGGDYDDCRDRAYAERVIGAYMAHWVPEAWQHGDAEVIARTHNGGPNGRNKATTLRYWQRVRAALP